MKELKFYEKVFIAKCLRLRVFEAKVQVKVYQKMIFTSLVIKLCLDF